VGTVPDRVHCIACLHLTPISKLGDDALAALAVAVDEALIVCVKAGRPIGNVRAVPVSETDRLPTLADVRSEVAAHVTRAIGIHQAPVHNTRARDAHAVRALGSVGHPLVVALGGLVVVQVVCAGHRVGRDLPSTLAERRVTEAEPGPLIAVALVLRRVRIAVIADGALLHVVANAPSGVAGVDFAFVVHAAAVRIGVALGRDLDRHRIAPRGTTRGDEDAQDHQRRQLRRLHGYPPS